MNFKPFDRLPLLEWAAWWDKTIERWHAEGLPSNVTDRYDICRHFGLDIYKQDWFAVCRPDCPSPKSHGSGIIENESDYDALRKFLYPPCPVDRKRWEQWAGEQKKGEIVLWFSVDGFFWFPRKLLGIERHLYSFYDQPRLVHRINSDLTEWILRVIDQVCAICFPDFMSFGEDLSYNHGPMLSKPLFDEFLLPYYKKVIPRLKEMTMNKGEAAMRAEFERLLPTAAKGGFLPSCDHQTPPGVSYKDYRLYVSLFQEYAQKAGRMSE